MASSSYFFRHWYSHDVLPLAFLMASVLGGVGYVGFRAAHAPDVVWSRRNNPEPWTAIRDDEGVKLVQINVCPQWLCSSHLSLLVAPGEYE